MPECGKVDVSDTASSCPNCGFNIAEYMEFIRKKEADKQSAVREIMLNSYTEEDIERHLARQFPDILKVSIVSILIGVSGTICLILALAIDINLIFLALLSLGISYACYRSQDATREVRDNTRKQLNEKYRTDIKNPQERREVLLVEIEKYFSDPEGYDKQYILDTNLAKVMPKCPLCGSRSIGRIDTVGRIVSVSIFGLASNKIGKNMACKTCKYTW